MDFRTIVEINKPDFDINHHNKITLTGSCFTENIGNLLFKNFFDVDINPCGIIYNPVSISKSISFLLDNNYFTESDLQYANNKWFSFYFHGNFANVDKEKTLDAINNRIQYSAKRLRESKFLFITFGTAWVYRHKELDFVVSNCHKIPSNYFERRLLSIDEIVDIYNLLIIRLLEINPQIRIVFTVSPIRHWKDGANGNQISKSILLLTINKLVNMFSESFYFPSYEIVMDELRDYRFYTADMQHISDIAVEYIWERFADTFFNHSTDQILDDLKFLKHAADHKIVDNENNGSILFKEKVIKQTKILSEKYPQIDFQRIFKQFVDKM